MITVEIGGRQRPFKFGFNAIETACKVNNTDLAGFQGILQNMAAGKIVLGEFRSLLYSGFVGGALSTKQAIDFSVDDVGDWLDDIGGIESIGGDTVKPMLTEMQSGFSKKKVTENLVI